MASSFRDRGSCPPPASGAGARTPGDPHEGQRGPGQVVDPQLAGRTGRAGQARTEALRRAPGTIRRGARRRVSAWRARVRWRARRSPEANGPSGAMVPSAVTGEGLPGVMVGW